LPCAGTRNHRLAASTAHAIRRRAHCISVFADSDELDAAGLVHRPVEGQVLERFMACGDRHHGFACIYCNQCGHDYLLAYSCKTRYFCPSCRQKRMLAYGEWLEQNLLTPVPHRRKANWTRLIQKVYEVDPLECLNCGATMRIIAPRRGLAPCSLPGSCVGLRRPANRDMPTLIVPCPRGRKIGVGSLRRFEFNPRQRRILRDGFKRQTRQEHSELGLETREDSCRLTSSQGA